MVEVLVPLTVGQLGSLRRLLLRRMSELGLEQGDYDYFQYLNNYLKAYELRGKQ